MYTTVSDATFVKLTSTIDSIGSSVESTPEMQILKGLLPILIMTRGLIQPQLYQISATDLELELIIDRDHGSVSEPPAGTGGTYGGGNNVNLGGSTSIG